MLIDVLKYVAWLLSTGVALAGSWLFEFTEPDPDRGGRKRLTRPGKIFLPIVLLGLLTGVLASWQSDKVNRRAVDHQRSLAAQERARAEQQRLQQRAETARLREEIAEDRRADRRHDAQMNRQLLALAGSVQLILGGPPGTPGTSDPRLTPRTSGEAADVIRQRLASPVAIDRYYDGVDTASSAALRTSLHATIKDHLPFPYIAREEDDTQGILEIAEADLTAPTRVLAFYKNESFPRAPAPPRQYDREMLWPRSFGLLGGKRPLNVAGVDCHNMRLAYRSYNAARSNRFFDDVLSDDRREFPTVETNGVGGQSTGTYPGDSNWSGESSAGRAWEVWRGRRGDAARALFYMDLRYEGGVNAVTGEIEPDLILTDDVSLIGVSQTSSDPQGPATAYMGLLSTLLRWHEQDPIDERELRRNDVVYRFQGNRNPFIDHPEWAAVAFAAGR